MMLVPAWDDADEEIPVDEFIFECGIAQRLLYTVLRETVTGQLGQMCDYIHHRVIVAIGYLEALLYLRLLLQRKIIEGWWAKISFDVLRKIGTTWRRSER
jgi:hypothetical protein